MPKRPRRSKKGGDAGLQNALVRIRREIHDSIKTNRDVFPDLPKTLKTLARKRGLEVREVRQAIRSLLEVVPGKEPNTYIATIRTPDGKRGVISRVVKTPRGYKWTTGDHAYAIAHLLGIEPREKAPSGYLPGLAPSPEEINRELERARRWPKRPKERRP